MILEDSDLPGAVRVAEDVRTALDSRPIPASDGTALRVTVSADCAMIDPAEPTMTALVSRADVGLFMAKRAGRNRVVAA